jgi:hypothetical protein
LVVGLKGEFAFRFWTEVLVQRGVAMLRRPGERRDFSLSGPGGHSISLARIGLGAQRADKAIRAMQGYAEKGNALQSEFHVEIMRRTRSGHKVRVIRQRPSPSRGQPESRQPGPPNTAPQAGDHGNPRQEPRHPRTSDDLGASYTDRLENVDETLIPDDVEEEASKGVARPDVALLHRLWRRLPTSKQINGLLDRIADEHGGPGPGWEWNAWHIREAIRRRTEPLEYLKSQASLSRSGTGAEPPSRSRSEGLEHIGTIAEGLARGLDARQAHRKTPSRSTPSGARATQ